MNFTCIADDSDIVSWRSEQYIGRDGTEIRFSELDTPGTTRGSPDHPSTVAELVSSSDRNGIKVIRLTITVSTTIQQNGTEHSVTCVNDGLDTRRSFPFRMAGMYQRS